MEYRYEDARANMGMSHLRVSVTRVSVTRVSVTRVSVTRVSVTRVSVTRVEADGQSAKLSQVDFPEDAVLLGAAYCEAWAATW